MLTLDIIVRFFGLALLSLLAVQVLRDCKKSISAILLFLSCLSVAALYIGLAPEYLEIPYSVYVLVRLLDIPHLVFVWLFSLSLFQSEFRLKGIHFFIGAVYCLPIIAVRFAQFGILPEIKYAWVILANVFTLLLMGHLILIALKGRSDDLSETRRFSRICFAVAIGVIALFTAASEVLIVGTGRDHMGTVKTLIILPGIIWISIWLLRFDANILTFSETRKTDTSIDHRDTLLLQALESEIIENKAYLEPNLTIVALAARLGVTPNRLRRLINQTLGYKNFSSFINERRIQEVKAAFKDPKLSHVPILTLALDNGFASLSPFNKAFVQMEEMTPSQYRQSLKM